MGEDFADDFESDENPLTAVEFVCTAAVARDRLDLLGVTPDLSRRLFEIGRQHDIGRYESYRDRMPDMLAEPLRVLSSLTVNNWLRAFDRIRSENLTRDALDEIPHRDGDLPLLRYMLDFSRDLYGFPGGNCLPALRLIVDESSAMEEISYDLTDLVAGQCIDLAGLLAEAEYVHDQILSEHQVVVLTEGKTDSRLLERSLALHFPHLKDYFRFLDFEGVRTSGGAGELANRVRSFMGARVKERILAIFDNDTAAEAALTGPDLRVLPDNFVVCRYPDSELARSYPTIGPSGAQTMNVNGRAASLELYLGQDVLRDPDGVLRPVQWKGYEDKVGAYQGEVRDKNLILAAFESKLRSCEKDPGQVPSYDWDGILSILNVLRSAFHPVDTGTLLDRGGFY